VEEYYPLGLTAWAGDGGMADGMVVYACASHVASVWNAWHVVTRFTDAFSGASASE